jgi:DNA-binding NarL/FixJ family response regulator
MTTIAIVDDHPAFCLGVRQICEEAGAVEVAGAYGSIQGFLEAATHEIDIVIVELRLASYGGGDGSDGIRALQLRGHDVLVMSSLGTRDSVVRAMEAGAAGYLTKTAGCQEIATAIITIARGEKYVGPTLAAEVLTCDDVRAECLLTARERDVLRELAAGHSDRDIAERLYVSVHTVRTHLDRIATKLCVRNRVQLAVWAVGQGLVDVARKPRHESARERPASPVVM